MNKSEEYTVTCFRTSKTVQVWAYHEGEAKRKGTLLLKSSVVSVRLGK